MRIPDREKRGREGVEERKKEKRGNENLIEGWETHLDPEFLFKFPRLFNHCPFWTSSSVSTLNRVVPKGVQLLPAKVERKSLSISAA